MRAIVTDWGLSQGHLSRVVEASAPPFARRRKDDCDFTAGIHPLPPELHSFFLERGEHLLLRGRQFARTPIDATANPEAKRETREDATRTDGCL